MESEIFVNTGSGNGLLANGTKPLPETMLTRYLPSMRSSDIYAIWLNTSDTDPQYLHVFEITATSLRVQWVNKVGGQPDSLDNCLNSFLPSAVYMHQ